MRRKQRFRARRSRGGTVGSLLVGLSVLGAVTATTVVVAPHYLEAATAVPEPFAVQARAPRHQALIEALAGMIVQSVGVIAVHDRGSSPFVEIVLWLADEENRGHLDEREVAVISHSRIMRTVTLYRLPPDAGVAGVREAEGVREPGFCDLWRADPRVEPVILMTDVSEMQIERRLDAGPQLAVTLSWSEDSADGDDKASVVVAARTPWADAPRSKHGGVQ